MQNFEIKVCVKDLEVIRRNCQKLGAEFQWDRRQCDTYFRVPEGRLKLREETDRATLIAYQRPDTEGSRCCQYELFPVTDTRGLKRALAISPGIRVIVSKHRELWLFGHTRIHLDRVNDLGTFVELETVIDTQTLAEAEHEHQKVFDALRLRDGGTIAESYCDLIERSENC